MDMLWDFLLVVIVTILIMAAMLIITGCEFQVQVAVIKNCHINNTVTFYNNFHRHGVSRPSPPILTLCTPCLSFFNFQL